MVDAIVSFSVERLWELVSQEYELLQGVEEQITELKSDLNMLMSFLKDADEKKQTSALARNCVEEVKEITYDAEHIIETFLLKEERRRLACIPSGRRDIALQITSISKRISKVIHVMQTFEIRPIIIDGGTSQALHERKRLMRHTFSSESESNLVGLEKNVVKLVGELVENDSSQVVSITGLGGLGKTTLARHVFNHDLVKRHFDGLAWVFVSQEFTRKDVWKRILRSLSPQYKHLDMTEEEIQEKLFQLLKTQKALIVFDDIWTKKDWDTLKLIFPEISGACWKVLLTSRVDAIHQQCVNIKPEVLTPDESLTLLEMIAFPKNDTTAKTDLSKTCDWVEWSFIKNLMRKLGFADKWVQWMIWCIHSVQYKILINDTPQEYIKPERTLRQGKQINFEKPSIQFDHKIEEGIKGQAHQTLGITKTGGMENYISLPESMGGAKSQRP